MASSTLAGDRHKERRPLVLRESQGVGEGSYGVRVGAPRLAPLQVADGVGGKPRPKGKLFLRHAGRLSQTPQHSSER